MHCIIIFWFLLSDTSEWQAQYRIIPNIRPLLVRDVVHNEFGVNKLFHIFFYSRLIPRLIFEFKYVNTGDCEKSYGLR